MESIIITPKNKNQVKKILEFARQLGLKTKSLSKDDKEDVAMLKAIQEVENDKSIVSLTTFLKKLRNL